MRFIAGIGNAARPQSIAQREAHVVLRHHLHDAVEVLVEEVLPVVVGHPLRQDGAAPADDSGDAAGHHGHILDQHAGVHGEVVHTLLGLLLDDLEIHIDVQVLEPLHAVQRLIDRHRADGHRRVAQDGLANLRDVAAGREIHHRIGAEADRGMKLGEFLVDVRGHGGVADIGVDLAAGRDADRHRLELGMVDIRRDDEAAGGDLGADQPASSSSRLATNSISSVMRPSRA